MQLRIMKVMRVIFYTLGLCSVLTFSSFAQTVDSTYIENNKKIIMIMGFVSRNYIQIDKDYKPNSPINLGIGLSVKNTLLRFGLSLPVVSLNEDKYGKTENTDIQIHHFGRHFLFDLFYQRYKGFYSDDKETKLFPDMLLQQIGFEGTYLFNGNKFSSKAAFGQNEKQLKSAGSFVLGGGVYHYKIDTLSSKSQSFNNLLFALDAGYAYSWVLSDNWLITGIASVGITLGNETEKLKDGKIKVYPTVFARGAIGYHKSSDWGIVFSFLLNNKSVHYPHNNKFDLTAINMQISLIRYLDGFF